jgi:asparagine synthase (glutamine-hydrolysing)
MCGIAGIFRFSPPFPVEEAPLLSMRESMVHRGPDGAGLHRSGPVGLAHRRLSIIDLEGGSQPLPNEDGSLQLVCNGEVYNHVELRPELQKQGHRFRTRSDNEVILHLYEEHGLEFVHRLNGMFAFALWDEREQRLLLARDRLGIKPLYYHANKKQLLFGSEIKAILRYPGFNPRPRLEGIPEYLVFRHLAGEKTFFLDILNLLPGHLLTVDRTGYAIRRYWAPPEEPSEAPIPEPEWRRKADELLQDSVRLRLRSDVPVGTLCSGGVDSSLVTALAGRHQRSPMHTFCVGFQESGFDERSYARLVSARYGTTHHELLIDSETFASQWPETIRLNDEPLDHPNSVAIYLISKLAKSHITVMLTGEGADELFWGYPRYQIPYLTARWGAWIRIFSPLLDPDSPFPRKLRDASRNDSPFHINALYNSAFCDSGLPTRLLEKGPTVDLSFRQGCLEQGRTSPSPLGNLQRLELRTYLVSILNRQDKMSMGASIEARVPFLDYRLVEAVCNYPAGANFRILRPKHHLKRIARGYLPRPITRRKKVGFAIPLSDWLRSPSGLGERLDLLRSRRFRERGLWNAGAVDALVEQHRSGRKDHANTLWTLLNLEWWFRTHIDRPQEAARA